jgi:gluconolactonase
MSRTGILALVALILIVPCVAADETIFAPQAELKAEAANGSGGEGPAWHPRLGVLSSGNGHIYQFDRQGQSQVFRKDAGTNGLLFDAKGRLLACEPKLRRVTRTEPDGTLTVLTDRYEGKGYNQPNDLTVDSQGRIYFSDPRYGSREGMEIRDAHGRTIEGVYRIDPDGTVTRIIGRELDRPNGVLVSADDRFLFVADNNNDTVGGARKLYRFDLRRDGTVDLASRKLLHDWGKGRGPDGLKQDQHGRLYVAAGLNKANPPAEPADDVKGGIYVLSPEGRLLTFLPVPRDEVTNCAFGGDDFKTLYVTAGGTLYSIRTTTPGRVVWPVGNAKPNQPAQRTGPWNLAALKQAPKVTVAGESRPVTSLYYENEPYLGKPTRVFAYLAKPEKVESKLPAMVLVHGGGGTAFQEWAELWAKRGYVALAMDLAGQGPELPRGFRRNPRRVAARQLAGS